MTEEQWDRVIDINLKGVFNYTQAVVEVMVNQGTGVIINTSSIVGLNGNVGHCHGGKEEIIWERERIGR